MSDSRIKLSSSAAFSYHWNKGIDSNSPYFIRLGKSMAFFLKAFFCDYTVSEIEAKALLKGDGNHGNSIFINECKKKFENFNIEIVNEPSIGTQEYYDEEQKNKRNDNTEMSNGSDKQESLGIKNNELEKTEIMSKVTVSVDDLENLIKCKYCKNPGQYFSEDKLALLNPEDCFRLFKSALIGGHNEIALLLLLTKKCDELMRLSEDGMTNALSFFVTLASSLGIKYLLDNDLVKFNAKNVNSDTPIAIANKAGNVECLKMLLEKGATLEKDNDYLNYAARNGYVGCLNVLLEAGANPNKANALGMTPLHSAAKNGHAESLKVLVAADADVHQVNHKGLSPIHSATEAGHEACLKVLVEAGAKVNEMHGGSTPLCMAIKTGHIGSVNVLLNTPGINVNMVSGDADTPLHTAVKHNKKECLIALIGKEGIQFNLRNKDGCTPMDCAIQKDLEECFITLRARITTPENRDSDDQKLLQLIFKNDSRACLKKLLSVKAIDINALYDNGDALLHLAIIANSKKCFGALLKEHKVDVNKANSRGCTPLHLAAKNGLLEYIQTLLAMEHINISKVDNDGRTPINLLEDTDYETCKEALRNHK